MTITAGDLGFFSFTKDELLAFMAVERDLSLERNFEMNNNDKGWLKISFSVCAPQADKSNTSTLSRGTFSLRREPTLISTGNDASHAEHLCAAAFVLFQQFKTSGVLSHLDQAILSMEAGISHTADEDINLAGHLHNCGNLFRTRFERKGNTQDLEMVILYTKKAVGIAPENHSDLPIMYNSLGNAFRLHFQCTGDTEDLQNAIMYQQSSVQLTPDGNPHLPSRLNDLAISLRIRFQHIGNHFDLESALESLQRVVTLTPEGHPARPKILNSLGNAFLVRFKLTEDLQDLDNTIENQQQAIQLLSLDSPDLPLCLANVGSALETRFTHKGDLADLNNAIHCQQQAIEITPQANPNWPGLLGTLGAALCTRFSHTGDLADLDNSISNQQKAVELTPTTHINLPRFLGSLGNAFELRFQRTGDREDINNAIFNREKALQLLPEVSPDLPNHLSNLGKSFISRFERFGDIEDINRAITKYQRALEITPEGHTQLPIQLSDLSASFTIRFQYLGEPNDIKTAISVQERAILITPAGHTSRHRQLGNLGTMYHMRFQHFGDLLDVERAILNLQKAVQAMPEGHLGLPGTLTNLASAFGLRFGHTDDVLDIQKAIWNQERAVRLTPADHPDLPIRLDNLGCCFFDCFKHTNNLKDIENAISNHQRAVDLASNNSPAFYQSLYNLGSSLQVQFEHNRSPTDIERAILNRQRAIDLVPENHANLPRLLFGLGVSFSVRFEQTKDLADLENAFLNFQRAVRITPKEHAKLPSRLHDLACLFRTRFELTQDPQDLCEALSLLRTAATQRLGHPSERLSAAIKWAKIDNSDSLEAFRVAIGLLPQVAGLEQTIHKRHESLLDIAHLTASATAAAIKNEAIELALAWLEQGRCLVWNQISQLRAPADRLRESDPSLAEDFLHVAQALETSAYRQQEVISFSITAESIAFQGRVQTHVRLAKDWEQLLSEIRAKPGLEDFLQPPNTADLLTCLPREGSVVIFNIDESRCDALALVSGCDGPIHIPLESFTYEHALRLSGDLRSFLKQKGARIEVGSEEYVDRAGRKERSDVEQNSIQRILRTLWLYVVKPVLDALGFSSPVADRPRIWWCPTGPLSFLPVHAAGIYGPEVEGDEFPASDRLSVSDFVISSYTPTVSMLLDKLGEVSGGNPKGSTMVPVSQPATPGCRRIPGAHEETKALRAMMGERGTEVCVLEGDAGTIAQVKEDIGRHGWVHFACHGIQNSIEPLNSGFHLHDGLLQLHDIMPLNLAKAEHAFLSACQTSTGDERLRDEVVHLAAGMLAAGYRGVVATMWSIEDQYGAEIASNFYSHLLDNAKLTTDGGSSAQQLNAGGAARALDFSMQKLREKLGGGERALLASLPYVHFGV